jgi:hypothetical protein
LAAIPVGAVMFWMGAAPVAADEADAGKAGAGTTVTRFAEIPEFPTSAAALGTSARSDAPQTAAATRDAAGTPTRNSKAADHRRSDAKARKNDEVEAATVADFQPQAAVVGGEDQICKSTPMTGTRLRKQVCVSAAQQEVNNKYQERQAQDYLRMLSEQALRAPARPSPYISVSPGF